ncbi:flagellar hook protein FlgE [Austwickia sp. TVS 96-490-7B]|uniref:flagellar hook protein FlgE n=1 Tax=Austwickia sp. TVS 96-490-7B TaxID=2830843 RepID=UPI0021029F6A|nr:flagellar hook-basal body complex protein [Austwickia sp. TVS 96-490-7B]
MYSAVSGLRVHQTMLDVTGNNIANVNTFGFKAGRAVFEDNLSQIIRGSSAPVPAAGGGPGIGGVNPAQVGLGARLGAITNLFSQGGLQVTNQTTDVAIQGDGFFTVEKAGANFFTRNGAFNFDTDGNLVTSNGSYVLGYMYAPGGRVAATNSQADQAAAMAGNVMLDKNGVMVTATTTPGDLQAVPLKLPTALINGFRSGANQTFKIASTGVNANGEATAGTPGTLHWDQYMQGMDNAAGGTVQNKDLAMESFQINPDGKLVGSFSDGTKRVFGQIALTTFNNPPGLEKVGGSMYRQTNNSGVPDTGVPANGGRGTVESGTLEMSNVDLAQEFTNLIVAQRGFQANSKVVSTSDEVLSDLIQMKR